MLFSFGRFEQNPLAAREWFDGRNSNTTADHLDPALGVVWHGLTSFSVSRKCVHSQPRPSLPTFREKVFSLCAFFLLFVSHQYSRASPLTLLVGSRVN